MGPITLFDKSFIEMLSVDEATLFDALYRTVICPIFYSEVLADLSKSPPGTRSVEQIVADVAAKTPVMGSIPNVFHTTICVNELLGFRVELRRAPAIASGRPVRKANGEIGVVYEHAPEAQAFQRWQAGDFWEVERRFAKQWREQLSVTDHAETGKLARHALAVRDVPRNLKEAMEIAQESVRGRGQRYRTLVTACALLGLPWSYFPRVRQRWIDLGGPSLEDFAPYVAHCLLVDMFFHVAVDKMLISPDRASNRIDIAYLYYLPFTMVFVSNDKLHARTAPLFLKEGQKFVWGGDLKMILLFIDVERNTRGAEYQAAETKKAIMALLQAVTKPRDQAPPQQRPTGSTPQPVRHST